MRRLHYLHPFQLCVTVSQLPYDQMKDWIDEMTLTLLFNSIQIQSEIK